MRRATYIEERRGEIRTAVLLFFQSENRFEKEKALTRAHGASVWGSALAGWLRECRSPIVNRKRR